MSQIIGLSGMSFREFMEYISEIRIDFHLEQISLEEKNRLESEVQSIYPNWTYGINPNINPEFL